MLTIILSVFALASPGYTFISVVVILAVVMLFVGFEKIITGIFLPSRSSRGRLATVGLGILVLIFAGVALAFPVATAFVGIIFIGVALLFSGIARIVEGISGEHSGWSKTFLIAVGLLAVILSFAVMASPAFGAACGRSNNSDSTFDNWNPDSSSWYLGTKIPKPYGQIHAFIT